MWLTVIIPAYNASETIRDCLNSVLTQTGVVYGTDYRVIVVDDGSTDNTVELIQSFPVEIIRHDQNRGRIAARETGVKAASTDLIMLCDSRVTLAPDLIAIYRESFSEYETCCAAGELDLIGKDGPPISRLFWLMRKKYYKGYFPQKVPVVEINRENFNRVPKGFTCFICRQVDFLNSLPQNRERGMNDDTLIIYNMISNLNTRVFRNSELSITYKQREAHSNLYTWIWGRGVLFSSYNLGLDLKYRLLYALSVIFVISIFGAVALAPTLAIALIAILAVSYLLIAVYLGETASDLMLILPRLYLIIISFWLGVTAGIISSATRSNVS